MQHHNSILPVSFGGGLWAAVNFCVMASLYFCEIISDICWFIHSARLPLALSLSPPLPLSPGITACDLGLQQPE